MRIGPFFNSFKSERFEKGSGKKYLLVLGQLIKIGLSVLYLED